MKRQKANKSFYFKVYSMFICLDCGVPNTKISQRMEGGEETDSGEYPWQVLY